MANVKGGVLAKKNTQPNMIQLVQSMENQIKRALPTVITGERFTRMVTTALSSNPDLMKCTPKSFLGAMMQAAQLGLEPNTPLGQAYLIPRKNKQKDGTYRMECSFELGYKGMIDLSYRSGEIRDISAHEVYENDELDFEYGLEPKLKHKPALRKRGKIIGYYAVYHTIGGGFGMEFMSMEDMQAFAHRYSVAYAKGYNTPWKTNFDEMAKKTVLKRVLKYAPLKSEFVKAVETDGTIKDLPLDAEDGDIKMADLPDQTDYTETTATVEEERQPEKKTVVDPETGEVKPAEEQPGLELTPEDRAAMEAGMGQ